MVRRGRRRSRQASCPDASEALAGHVVRGDRNPERVHRAPSASVVLVDDSVPYARVLEVILAEAVDGGVAVRHHRTVAAALADLRERPADVVLLDLGLPGAGGLEALALVLAAAEDAALIGLRGRDGAELALDAIRAGAQDCLVKGQEHQPRPFVRAIRFAIERGRSQERNEDLLRAKEDRWRTLTHLAPVGIVEIDEAGRCMFANDWVVELTGRGVDALVGEGWRAALHPDDAAAFERAWRAAAADGGAGEFSLETRFRGPGPGGVVRWAHVTGVLLRDPWGGAAGWLGTLVDVTPAREAREALARVQADVLALVALTREASVADVPVDVLLTGACDVLAADDVELIEGDEIAASATHGPIVERPIRRGDATLGLVRVT